MDQLTRISLMQQSQHPFFVPMPYLPHNSYTYSVPVDINTVFLNVTKDVSIKPVHSHNDYTRSVPLLEALSYGVQSVEADLWSFDQATDTTTETTANQPANNTNTIDNKPVAKAAAWNKTELYVAHTLPEIKQSWTLRSLYLDPIYALLKQSNHHQPADNGVFMANFSQTLYLFLDFKTSAASTWPLVEQHLQRFRDENLLTYYDDRRQQWVIRPLTIVCTGNLPVDQVKQLDVRYVTLDGDLTLFKDKVAPETELSEIPKYSMIASQSMSNMLGTQWFQVRGFSVDEQKLLKTAIDNAHNHGIKTRIWGGVSWNSVLRDKEDLALYEMGTDLLNLDDLKMSSRYT